MLPLHSLVNVVSVLLVVLAIMRAVAWRVA